MTINLPCENSDRSISPSLFTHKTLISAYTNCRIKIEDTTY